MIDPQTWLGWANYYAQQGLAVLPLRGKVPLTQRGVHDASRDPAQLAAWAQQYPGANIGVAIPDGKAVIDVDPRNDGETTIDNLERAHGQLPYAASPAANTGGGGWHLWLDVPLGHALPSNLGPGVDVKQTGGYVVAAPSIHPETGRPYAWLNGQLPHERTPQPLPQWLAAHAKPRGASRAKAVALDEIDDVRRDAAGWGLDPDLVVQDVSPEAIRQAVAAVAPIYAPGNRHHVRVKMGSVLNRLGWSADSVRAFGLALFDEYGGDNPDKIARSAVAGMQYPSGYFELCAMLPAGPLRENLQRALDGLHNPYGVHLREARAASAADVMSRLAAIEAKLEATPEAEREDEFFGWLAADSNGPPAPALVEGLDLAEGRTTGIAGLPHAGKTPLALTLALLIANGKPWLGRETQRRPVLYLNFEKGFDAVAKRERAARGLGLDPRSLYLLNLGDKGAFLNDKADTAAKLVAVVKRTIAKHGQAPMLIIDTLSNSVAGVEHNAAAYAEPLRELIVAARQIDRSVPVAVLLHCRKSLLGNLRPTLNDIEGSVQIVGICDAVIGLHKPDAANGNKVVISAVRTLADEHPPIEIEWAGGKDEPLTCTEVSERTVAKPKARTKTELQTRVYQDLVNAIESAPEGTHWSIPQLKAAARALKKDAQAREAFLVAVKIAVEDELIEPVGGTKKDPDAYRKLTAKELAARRKGLARTVELHERNALMVADSLLETDAVPIGAPGQAPSPTFGGFQNGTKSNVVHFPSGASPRGG